MKKTAFLTISIALLFAASLSSLAQKSAPADADVLFRMKIRAAKDAGIDTTREFINEFNSYARELAFPYLRDKRVDDSLILVSYGHLKEIVDVSQAFIPLPQNPAETNAARAKAYELKAALAANEAAGEKASVTAGNWPYFFEEMAFNTAVGKVTDVVESPYGFHVLRVIARRTNPNPVPELDSVKEAIQNAILKDERSILAVKRTIDQWKTQDPSRKGLPFNKAIDQYIQELPAISQPYKKALEDYRNGMLIYEITDREVWHKAKIDTAGMQSFFEAHRKDFIWEKPHYKGFVISATTDSLADAAARYLSETSDPGASRPTEIRKRFGNRVKVDKIIVAQGDNKVVDYLCFGGVKPRDDYWKAFRTAHGKIITSPECAADIKGPVTEKYQQELEKVWITTLRERYSTVSSGN